VRVCTSFFLHEKRVFAWRVCVHSRKKVAYFKYQCYSRAEQISVTTIFTTNITTPPPSVTTNVTRGRSTSWFALQTALSDAFFVALSSLLLYSVFLLHTVVVNEAKKCPALCTPQKALEVGCDCCQAKWGVLAKGRGLENGQEAAGKHTLDRVEMYKGLCTHKHAHMHTHMHTHTYTHTRMCTRARLLIFMYYTPSWASSWKSLCVQCRPRAGWLATWDSSSDPCCTHTHTYTYVWTYCLMWYGRGRWLFAVVLA
jgi:hypothetical protein